MLPENNILLEDHSWRRLSLVKAVVAHGVASFNAGASHTSDVMNRLAIEHCDHCLPRCKTQTSEEHVKKQGRRKTVTSVN